MVGHGDVVFAWRVLWWSDAWNFLVDNDHIRLFKCRGAMGKQIGWFLAHRHLTIAL